MSQHENSMSSFLQAFPILTKCQCMHFQDNISWHFDPYCEEIKTLQIPTLTDLTSMYVTQAEPDPNIGSTVLVSVHDCRPSMLQQLQISIDTWKMNVF